jgi:hypothetical protein
MYKYHKYINLTFAEAKALKKKSDNSIKNVNFNKYISEKYPKYFQDVVHLPKRNLSKQNAN